MLSRKICTALGISQRELANWLKTDQSILSRYEKGEKSIPTAALLQLAAMDNTIAQLSIPPREPTATDIQHIQQYLQQCCQQLANTDKKIEKAANATQQAQTLLAYCTVLQQQPLNKQQINWVQQQIYLAQQVLKTYNWATMQTLYIQQQLLQKQKNLYEMLLKQ